ncbi:hypothetical protein [Faecalibacterium sp. Marseille-Q3530]|uniref:hypothetical protein n=1 Tax=Faecalibacterium sp. Marseille-Q3530 TaxID=2758403 RepID=UPI001A9B5F28|nr:hypothetical protein [Faecalibacterium sp. Marseille-Q3530]MBO1289316.1 hypothetical protein [Faecalibacterium sp. Marseille-Q3530]
MSISILLLGASALAGAAGVGGIAKGGSQVLKANSTMKELQVQHQQNLARLEKRNKECVRDMDKLGRKELEILKSFQEFSTVFEKIKNRPEFAKIQKQGICLPQYDGEELKKASVGANTLLGGLGGAAAGTAGGFAASGAATAVVMALGTASTGVPIASLSGAAATNATLAALGGGSLAAGGGGMALGTTVLGAATLGVGLLIGGVIFGIAGGKISSDAKKAQKEIEKETQQTEEICNYLLDLQGTANRYGRKLDEVGSMYHEHMEKLKWMVVMQGRADWDWYTEPEKQLVNNTALLVKLLYDMCKVELVQKSEEEDAMNTINTTGLKEQYQKVEQVTESLNANF